MPILAGTLSFEAHPDRIEAIRSRRFTLNLPLQETTTRLFNPSPSLCQIRTPSRHPCSAYTSPIFSVFMVLVVGVTSFHACGNLLRWRGDQSQPVRFLVCDWYHGIHDEVDRTQFTLQRYWYSTRPVDELTALPLVSGHRRLSGVSCARASAGFDGMGDAVVAVIVAVAVPRERAGVLLDSMALPMKPPISPETMAMTSAPARRNGHPH
jgi:hypothetical protein